MDFNRIKNSAWRNSSNEAIALFAGMVPEQEDKMAEKARGRNGDGEKAARRGRGRRCGG